MPTIKDVAREAGVSTATVSYVLNSSGNISQETRRRVLAAVERLGYRPSVIARGLQAGQSRMIGYSWRPVPPNQFNPILEKFMHSMAEAAAGRDFHVLAFPSTDPADEVMPYREMVASGRVDGFILSNTNLDDRRIRYLMDAGFPFVAFGRANPEWEFSWVDVDGSDGLRQVVEHLHAVGHRRIACLCWPEESLTGRQRLAGFCAAMEEAGLAVDAGWIMRVQNDYYQAYEATVQLLSLPPGRRPTAIAALTDLMAMGVMNAAADGGLRVGRELAVTGFDDAPITGYLRPSLTSVRQPIAQAGEEVVRMLLGLLDGETPSPAASLLKPRLIVRDSTAPDGGQAKG
ncbi:MAG TPA: LacI family DNA-binding transcriptional regulator [Anaerolineae bacterium]|nr:LacI family DNA-binding transcriptional regulator [Anaerolineae bacterium]